MKTRNNKQHIKNREKGREGLPKRRLGRALRASHHKRLQSQGTTDGKQGERKAEKWGRRWRRVARVWVKKGFQNKWPRALIYRTHSGRAQGRPGGALASRPFVKIWYFDNFHRIAPGLVPRVLGRVAKGSDYTQTHRSSCERLRQSNELNSKHGSTNTIMSR